jgi:ketosteroid isomerase-like protein
MSQENVEIVRRLLDAFNRQDPAAVAELWDVAGEWRPAFTGGGLLEGVSFRGRQGAIEYVELQSETWKRVVADPVEIHDLGDDVLVEVHVQAVGRASGTPVDRVTWNVFHVRGGKVASGTVYLTKEDALKAVGLAE